MGRSALTSNCHLPCPVPSAPLRPVPSPDSNCWALSIREAPAASENSTVPVEDAPAASMPSMRTAALCVPGLTTRSRLAWFLFRPGLKMTTRWPRGVSGATSCMLVRNPSRVRM